MLSDRSIPQMPRRAALLALLALGGCGFKPLYGSQGSPLFGTIAFQTPDTVPGYHMRRHFEDRLGIPGTAQAQLAIQMEQSTGPAAITTDGDTVRLNVNGTANWVLTTTDGQSLGSGKVRSFTSYSTTASTVATQSAADDAAKQLAIALADLIIAQVILLDLPQ